jgi:hypothetical protein
MLHQTRPIGKPRPFRPSAAGGVFGVSGVITGKSAARVESSLPGEQVARSLGHDLCWRAQTGGIAEEDPTIHYEMRMHLKRNKRLKPPNQS